MAVVIVSVPTQVVPPYWSHWILIDNFLIYEVLKEAGQRSEIHLDGLLADTSLFFQVRQKVSKYIAIDFQQIKPPILDNIRRIS